MLCGMKISKASLCRLTAITLAFAAPLGFAQAQEKTIYVDLDYARILRLPEGAQTLVLGNPLIADVTMLKTNRLMVVTGKSFGATNLIILDNSGSQVGESLITVVPPNDKLVVMRGPHRESYWCNPDCAPAVDLGDDHAYMNEAIAAIKTHEGALTLGKR
jgi:Flp pilus assembly secretin CpaC